MGQSKQERLEEMIEAAREFRFCGPSDDPEKQTAVIGAYKYIVTQLKRLAGPLLPEREAAILEGIEVDFTDLFSAYDASAEIDALLPSLDEVAKHADDPSLAGRPGAYLVDPELVEQIRGLGGDDFDSALLARMCEEINSSYVHGNVIATALLMRSVLNYVPPAFGKQDFRQVAAEVGRSLKESFGHLQEGLRKVADFHAHRQMSEADPCPTKAQVDPFKPQFELLLQETARRVKQTNQD